MKICPKCQNACSDDERFCFKCGAMLPEETNEPQDDPQGAPQVPTYQPPPAYAQYQQQAEHVGIGKWILCFIVSFIPIVGLVMLGVWGFGSSESNETFRNWARAQLVMKAIVVALCIVLIAAIVAIGVGLAGSTVYTYEYSY